MPAVMASGYIFNLGALGGGAMFLAATKHLYKWFSPSVRPYVCLSVRNTFLTMFSSSYHHEIF